MKNCFQRCTPEMLEDCSSLAPMLRCNMVQPALICLMSLNFFYSSKQCNVGISTPLDFMSRPFVPEETKTQNAFDGPRHESFPHISQLNALAWPSPSPHVPLRKPYN